MDKKLESRVAYLESVMLERRIAKLEAALKGDELIASFARFCKSCNLPEPIVNRGKAICEFNMDSFYRRIQRRMHYVGILKLYKNEPVRLVCNLKDASLDISFLGVTEKNILDEVTTVKFEFRDRMLVYIGESIDRILKEKSPVAQIR